MDRPRLLPFMPAVLAVGLAACQAPGGPTGSVGPVSTPPVVEPSSSAAPSTIPSTDAVPTASPTGQAIISGRVYDDNGVLMRQAKVQVTSPDRPEIAQTLTAAGGTYVVQVPTDVSVILTASQSNYTSRTRTIQTTSDGSDLTAFTLDFGGEQGGTPYALSDTLEIAETTPANQDKNVVAGPLAVSFRFSHPLSRDNQARFEDLLEVRFQLAGSTRTLRPGSLYDNESATVAWSADGQEGTFRFNAPIVTAGAGEPAVTVGLKEDVSLGDWPVTAEGDRLGGEPAPTTADAANVTVHQKMAPFFREPDPKAFPTSRPSKALLWGLTHRTTVSFSLARDERKPRVTKVTGYKGLDGATDRIDVEFDKPMRGFPKELIDTSVLKASNYRFVLGKSTTQADIDKFNQADPLKVGSVTSEALTFSTSKTNVVQIPLPNGTLSGYSKLKLSVDPSVKDIGGVAIQTSIQDPSTGLADHVLLGGLN